jgi:hypothetical protein
VLARDWPVRDGAENKEAGGLLDASLNPVRRACAPVRDDQALFDLKRSLIRDSAPNALQTPSDISRESIKGCCLL